MDKSEYEEPRCPMDNSMWVKKTVTPIPSDRVIAKEDEYLSANDYAAAERHLMYWLAEAENGNDDRGKLLIFNELMGLHRKLGNGEKAKFYAENAVKTAEMLGLQDTVSGATAYLNAGTVYKAFGEPEKSLAYFEKCKAVYDRELEPDSIKAAGLYNNMALTLVDLERFDEAEAMYLTALAAVSKTSKPEEAITLLNLADCAVAKKGMEAADEEVRSYLDRAEIALDSVPEKERDGYFAFVCEKCAPVFDYYGYFFAARRFADTAAAIYAAEK